MHSPDHVAAVLCASPAVEREAVVELCPWVSSLPDGDLEEMVGELAFAHPDHPRMEQLVDEWQVTAELWRDHPETARALAEPVE